MPLTLYVDTAAWHQHLRAVVADEPGLVPVAKGNGYGFSVPLLVRTAAELGVGRIAVGTVEDAAIALETFAGEVIVLEAPVGAEPLPSGEDQRVLYTAASVEAAAELAGHRLIVDCRTSLMRQGITESDLPALWQVTDGGRAIEAFSLHLPIDRPAGADPVTEIGRWVSTLTEAGHEVKTMYVSHLQAAELVMLTTEFPAIHFPQRVGTKLWLGRRSAFRAASTVLQVLPVRRGQRLGYRQYRSVRDGWLVMVAGGTSHGVGLEALGARRGLLPGAKILARSGLATMNRVRSPFSWGGHKQWFAEPPHMLVSMLSLPRDTEPPKPGAELDAELRYTVTRFDHVALSLATRLVAPGQPLLVGEAHEAVPASQQNGNGGRDSLGGAALWMVHVPDDQGARIGRGHGAGDFGRGEGGSAVAVHVERDDPLSHVADNALRDVVAVGGAGPEEPRRLAEQPGELGVVPGHLVVDLARVAGAGDAVSRPARD